MSYTRYFLFSYNLKKKNIEGESYQKGWKIYCGKERAFLRKRRTRMKVDQFQILSQVGQGGYGQVFFF